MAAIAGANPVARWQKRGIDAALILLVVSGVAWLVVHYTIGAGNEAVGLPHWSEAWLIKLHGLAAFAVLVFAGAFLPVHVPRGWRLRATRGLEIALLACLASTVVTAYCLYYFAPDSIRPALGWVHAIVGGVFGATLVVHRTRRSADR